MAQGIKAIELPTDLVVALFDFAGRNLSRDEWDYLKKWESTVRQGMVNAQREQESKGSETLVSPNPPFDPTTDAAAKKREMRAAKRAAVEAKRRLEKLPEEPVEITGTHGSTGA